MTDQPFSVLVVGGGAGGLELACKLGRKWGAERVALVDAKLFHIWKPSLHEVAAGTLDIHQEGLSYQMLAHDNGFSFLYDPMTGLDSAARQLVVGAVLDGHRGSAARAPGRLRVAGAGDRQRVQRLRRAGRRRARVLARRPAGRRALPPAHAAVAVAGRRAQEPRPAGRARHRDHRRRRHRRGAGRGAARGELAARAATGCATSTPRATCASASSKARRACRAVVRGRVDRRDTPADATPHRRQHVLPRGAHRSNQSDRCRRQRLRRRPVRLGRRHQGAAAARATWACR